MRAFVAAEINPHVHDWDEAKITPPELRAKAYKAGILPGVVGVPWPTKYAGSNIAGGVRPEEFDQFHELILMEEVANSASGGLVWGLIEGLAIGLPPVLHFGSDALKEEDAEITVKNVSIDRLYDFLKRIEEGNPLVKVRHLKVRKRFDNAKRLDATVTVGTFKTTS